MAPPPHLVLEMRFKSLQMGVHGQHGEAILRPTLGKDPGLLRLQRQPRVLVTARESKSAHQESGATNSRPRGCRHAPYSCPAPQELRHAQAARGRRGSAHRRAHASGALDPSSRAPAWRESWPRADGPLPLRASARPEHPAGPQDAQHGFNPRLSRYALRGGRELPQTRGRVWPLFILRRKPRGAIPSVADVGVNSPCREARRSRGSAPWRGGTRLGKAFRDGDVSGKTWGGDCGRDPTREARWTRICTISTPPAVAGLVSCFRNLGPLHARGPLRS